MVIVNERILARDPMEEIRRAFQLFDDDNTGKITLRNLRRVAKEIGDRLEDDELYVDSISSFFSISLLAPKSFSTACRTHVFLRTSADVCASNFLQTSHDRRVRP